MNRCSLFVFAGAAALALPTTAAGYKGAEQNARRVDAYANLWMLAEARAGRTPKGTQ